MMAALREWLAAVVVVSLLLGVAESLIPEGSIRKIAGFTGGLILMLTLVQPVLRTDLGRLRLDMDDYSGEITARQSSLAEEADQKLAGLIADQTEAYISDKATQLGLKITVRVRTEKGADGVPYPAEAEMSGPRSEALAVSIEEELGIPPERQDWNGAG
ncbi:MAG: stage III sporulation protein AF [Oscillibacter sp.]